MLWQSSALCLTCENKSVTHFFICMFYFQKRDKVQSKEEVEPVDEDYTKLKTPNTTKSLDYKIIRSRKGKIFATECVCVQ